MITVKNENGHPHIDGRICSYESKEIRSEIQDFAEVNDEFILPSKYTYVVTELNGFAKIVLKQQIEIDEELRTFNLHPHSNQSLKVLIENDEGRHFDKEEIQRLIFLLQEYIKRCA